MLVLRYYLWLAPATICGISLFIAIRKKIHRHFPIFVAFLAYNSVIETSVSAAVAFLCPLPVYRRWSTVDVVVLFLFQLIVFFELASKALASRFFLKRLPQFRLQWGIALLIVTAVCFAASLPQSVQERAMDIEQTLNFGMSFVEMGLLLGMIVCTRVLGISWRSLPAGIALGFGISGAAEVALAPLFLALGRKHYITLDIFRMIAFHICTVIWLVYILLPGSSRGKSEPDLQVSELELHSQQVQRMAGR